LTVNESEVIERVEALPDRYVGRVRPNDLYAMRAMSSGGEWGELVDLLVASLSLTRAAVTESERDELRSLLAAMNMEEEPLSGLNVEGSQRPEL
jgi:hypothetical protein